MNFLFLFGLIFLSGCIHRHDQKDRDTKASKAEINKSEGGAFVTPSKDLKALRLQSHIFVDEENKKKDISVQDLSKESIQARLTDIPVVIQSVFLHASIDSKNGKHLTYTSFKDYSDIFVFYQNELQQFGWQINTLYYDDCYAVITAKKPHKSAVFFLECNKGTWISSSRVIIHVVVTSA